MPTEPQAWPHIDRMVFVTQKISAW